MSSWGRWFEGAPVLRCLGRSGLRGDRGVSGVEMRASVTRWCPRTSRGSGGWGTLDPVRGLYRSDHATPEATPV